MIREFLPTESPILRQVAREVTEFPTEYLRELIDDMFETMRAGRGVGLAAPQIGVALRIVVIEFNESERAPGEPSIPPTVLINPRIIAGNGSVDGTEGCFSIPNKIGTVARYSEISYIYQDTSGKKIERAATGLHARIVQHEVDHLDGVLYVDKAIEVKSHVRDVS